MANVEVPVNKKYMLFAFNGEVMCFVHSLLNALDMKNKGYDVRLVIEGTATRLVRDLSDPKKPFSNLYEKAKQEGLIEGICRACSLKTGSLESAKEQGLLILDDMSGHPGFTRYLDRGYEVITF